MIVPASLDRLYNNANLSTYTTASITVTAGRPAAIHISAPETSGGANPPAPTVTGAGQTWTLEQTLDWDTAGPGRGSSWVLTTPATGGGSGTLSIDFGGTTILGCAWSVVEYAGADTTDAFLNFAVTGVNLADSSGSVTLAALANSDSIAVGLWAHRANEVTDFGAGFTELDDVSGTTPTWGTETEWRLNVTFVNASWATATNYGGIAYEVKAAVGVVAAPSDNPPIGLLGRGAGW